LAFLYKRRRDYKRAAELWHELAEDGSPPDQIVLIALEQLAMCYEHRLGEPGKAAAATRRALQVLDPVLAAEREGRRRRLAHRLRRLAGKTAGLYCTSFLE
jgi:hypothetical protein